MWGGCSYRCAEMGAVVMQGWRCLTLVLRFSKGDCEVQVQVQVQKCR